MLKGTVWFLSLLIAGCVSPPATDVDVVATFEFDATGCEEVGIATPVLEKNVEPYLQPGQTPMIDAAGYASVWLTTVTCVDTWTSAEGSGRFSSFSAGVWLRQEAPDTIELATIFSAFPDVATNAALTAMDWPVVPATDVRLYIDEWRSPLGAQHQAEAFTVTSWGWLRMEVSGHVQTTSNKDANWHAVTPTGPVRMHVELVDPVHIAGPGTLTVEPGSLLARLLGASQGSGLGFTILHDGLVGSAAAANA